MNQPFEISLRPPAEVMRLRRLGAMFPTRLSFLRTLLRQLRKEGAKVTRPVWAIDADGFGHAVYSVPLGGHMYSLVAISTNLPPEQRTDRVIATAWDSAYVLYDGVPDGAEISRIVASAPKQEAARFTSKDLVLSRANKSVRLFEHVVSALQAGGQPDTDLIQNCGYLMRTTAVYGNGKFGIADRAVIADRPGLSGPFMAEMLTVWLIRGFTHDLAEHVGGAALAPEIKRHLGIGNSTGLGMAPFLVSHPLLLHAWMNARETALARVRNLHGLSSDIKSSLGALAARAGRHLSEWQVPDAVAAQRLDALRNEWRNVQAWIDQLGNEPYPLNGLLLRSEAMSEDTQELLVSVVLEPFGEIIDDLAGEMSSAAMSRLDAGMTVETLQDIVARDWSWATQIDFTKPQERAQFWYVSEDKAEPRLGLRDSEPGADKESPLDIARQVAQMFALLKLAHGTVAEFVARHPEHRSAVRRVQTCATHPYSEIRDNLISDHCLPIDMLRCKLSFFGASKFDPKSDRWTRITLCQGAPLFDDLQTESYDFLPVFGA